VAAKSHSPPTERVITVAVDFETFDLTDLPAKPKGFEQKFFAETLPKYNQLVELRNQYLAIAGGVENAIKTVIDSVTEETNPEVFEMLNSIAEAEELIRELNAKVTEWAETQVSESTESPETVRESFDSVKAVLAKSIEGSRHYFETNDDIEESEDGGFVGATEAGEKFLKLTNLPAIRKGGKAGRPAGSGFGKKVREYVKANDVKGPNGETLGEFGVLPQWAKDAFLTANPGEQEFKG
jgi:hypothetical protein